MTSLKRKNSKTECKEGHEEGYSKLSRLNGKHSLRSVSPDCYVDYQARVRSGAEVVFFNYDLAKDMGIISKKHPEQMNSKLQDMIADAFGIVIINEYDLEHDKTFPQDEIKPGKYMATRYLQLQHPNKKGKTSGDGRSIWNGEVRHQGKVWDVTSCGTGATILSPATHIHGRLFETGDPTISYGCGYAEVDEGIETLFFSEVLNLNRLKTERVLAILRFPDGYGITVRAHENLLRPSHFFNHLKQNNHDTLKKLVDYYCARQVTNGLWSYLTGKKKYQNFLKRQCEVFARTAAIFEDEYIFCWMDWDGDNILMDGGIIDYGSVRQFGLFHHEYRFDDDDRFSTNILEQKSKAKYTVKCFIQLIDYILTGEKKSLSHYRNHKMLDHFESVFHEQKRLNILRKIGLSDDVALKLVAKEGVCVDQFIKTFSYFERAKSAEGLKEVMDGISWDAIFCMRDILRELPQLLMARGENISAVEFIEIIKSSYARAEDLEITPYRKRKIKKFQNEYKHLIELAAKYSNNSNMLLEVMMRSSVINKFDRVTGDSISTIRIKIMKKLKNMNSDDLYQVMKTFSYYQHLDPDGKKKDQVHNSPLMKGFIKVVKDFREGI